MSQTDFWRQTHKRQIRALCCAIALLNPSLSSSFIYWNKNKRLEGSLRIWPSSWRGRSPIGWTRHFSIKQGTLQTSETTTSISAAFLMRGLCYKFCLDTHWIVVCRTEQNTYGTMFRCLSTTRQVLLLRGRKRRGRVWSDLIAGATLSHCCSSIILNVCLACISFIYSDFAHTISIMSACKPSGNGQLTSVLIVSSFHGFVRAGRGGVFSQRYALPRFTYSEGSWLAILIRSYFLFWCTVQSTTYQLHIHKFYSGCETSQTTTFD